MFHTIYYIGHALYAEAYHDSLAEAVAWTRTLSAVKPPTCLDRVIIKHGSGPVGDCRYFLR
jgi:hypothetical protein